MEAMTLREILQATGGTLLGTLVDLDTPVGSVDTDSRAMTEGALFVPLVGERFDGHAYIGKSLENGAVGTLTDHELADYLSDKFYVLVRTPCWRWGTWRLIIAASLMSRSSPSPAAWARPPVRI